MPASQRPVSTPPVWTAFPCSSQAWEDTAKRQEMWYEMWTHFAACLAARETQGGVRADSEDELLVQLQLPCHLPLQQSGASSCQHETPDAFKGSSSHNGNAPKPWQIPVVPRVSAAITYKRHLLCMTIDSRWCRAWQMRGPRVFRSSSQHQGCCSGRQWTAFHGEVQERSPACCR